MRKHLLIVPFFTAFIVLAVFWSCSKSSSSAATTNTNVTLITQGTWLYDTSGIDLDQDGKIDNLDIPDTWLQPCEKDDIFTFNKDSTGLIDEGATKCSGTAPQTDPLTWSFSNNNTILNVASGTVLNGALNLLSLTSANLSLYKDTTVSGLSVRYLIILKH